MGDQEVPTISQRKFLIITDYKALTSIFTMLEPHGRMGRWAMMLQEYNFSIKHRCGKEYKAPDALSHNPVFESRQD